MNQLRRVLPAAAARVALGTVAEVWRYPVKSLRGELLDEATVGRDGVAGDRAYAVEDAATGRPLSAKREPRLLLAAAAYTVDGPVVTLPDGSAYAAPSPALDAALSDWLGRGVTLVGPGRYPDAAPLHALTTASLRAAAALHPAGDWSPRRFRPNVLVEVAGTEFAEDAWTGFAAVDLGATRAEPARPAVRCAMTSAAQPGLAADPGVLDTLRRAHDARLGLYLAVAVPGVIRAGDRVTAPRAG